MFAPHWERIIHSWPEVPKSVAREIIDKYGAPDVIGSDLFVWQNKGPYAWMQLHSHEVQHNFPMPHKDVLDIAIPYRIPATMCSQLCEFDGSVSVMRTRGLLIASCFKEALDLLTLNLANDVLTGKKTPEQARMEFGDIAQQVMKGEMPPYAEKLQFAVQPLSATEDPDKSLMPMTM